MSTEHTCEHMFDVEIHVERNINALNEDGYTDTPYILATCVRCGLELDRFAIETVLNEHFQQ